MEGQSSNKTFYLLLLILLLIGFSGIAYFFITQKNSTPNTSYTTVPTTNTPSNSTPGQTQTTPAQNTSTEASATLDQSSLSSNSNSPTISGKFISTSGIEVIIAKSSLPTHSLLSETIPGVVWDDRSDHGGGVVLQSPSSGNFSDIVTSPLSNGTYQIGVYTITLHYPRTGNNGALDSRQLLTQGTLIISNTR